MKFRVTCELDYTLHGPASFLFALKCMKSPGQRVLGESLVTNPVIEVEEFNIAGGLNRLSRIKTLNPGLLRMVHHAEVRTSPLVVSAGQPGVCAPGDLAPDAIPFLFPSRYCQSDRLRQMAQELFGHLGSPHEIASAVSDWIFGNIAYVPGSSGESCSALDTVNQQQGVCRDFAHLGIAFCRALNVPARYVTCYAHRLDPQDFHACFEALIGGSWHVFDATRLAPLNGLVRIATGRDAADVAVCTIFGNPELTRSWVSCECDDVNFTPLTHDDLARRNEALVLL
jgi:transglutaminase-like putative cysteine protease